MGESFADAATAGPLLLAIGAAALAGLVSFLSPCILPLVPGYLSYVTGLTGVELSSGARSARTAPGLVDRDLPSSLRSSGARSSVQNAAPRSGVGEVRPTRRGRVLAGTLLFVAGFTAVFTVMAVLSAGVGRLLFEHTRTLEIVGGVVIILMGLAFLGLVPLTQRQWRISRLPAAGLAGAPVFGGVFALSWVPCSGPTLGAVLTLAAVGGNTGRAATLAVAYGLGLGIPFVLFGVAFRRVLGVVTWIRRNSRWVTRLGGALLILVGLALVTGGWNAFTIWLRGLVGVGEVPL